MNSSVSFVSIIIPTYRDWKRLSLCLDSLSKQSWAQEHFEVIVVNNLPGDHAPDGFILPENTVIIDEPKPGSYAARNAALKIAKGSILGFTDSDCITDRDWISNAIAIFEENSAIDRIGGLIKIFFKAENPTNVELHDAIFAFPQEAYVKNGYAVTGNLFARSSVFTKVGMFDDSLASGGDYQWNMNAERGGFPIVFSENVLVNHPARDTVEELVKKEKRIGRGQAGFNKTQQGKYGKAIMEVLQLVKPRRWEIAKIFENAKNASLKSKISLVFLRHYIKIMGDLTRIYYVYKVNNHN